jgi:hypothetical protein
VSVEEPPVSVEELVVVSPVVVLVSSRPVESVVSPVEVPLVSATVVAPVDVSSVPAVESTDSLVVGPMLVEVPPVVLPAVVSSVSVTGAESLQPASGSASGARASITRRVRREAMLLVDRSGERMSIEREREVGTCGALPRSIWALGAGARRFEKNASPRNQTAAESDRARGRGE